MFTGIITDIGKVLDVKGASDIVAQIACTYDPDTLDIGASIACSGICLTVIDKGRDGDQAWFKVDISAETTRITSAGEWQTETLLNLERALKIGDELGGHLVSGHVDDLCQIVDVKDVGDSRCFRFRVEEKISRFIASKGSVCLDGTSFTVNDVEGCEFNINIIPHTLQVTTWGCKEKSDKVNLEIDVIARYVARLNAQTLT